MKQVPFIIILFLGFFIQSCSFHKINGNGDQTVEQRDAENFTAVTLVTNSNVYITQGDAYTVTVEAESNLLPYIETNLRGEELLIGSTHNFNLHPTLPITVRITMPDIKSVKVSGSGTIDAEGFDEQEIDVVLSGSGQINVTANTDLITANISGSGLINLAGNTIDQKLVISGSGKIQSYNLLAKNCQANISGSGDIFANPSDKLKVNISGSGSLYYKKSPVVETHISGSGRVIKEL
jgi:hypothetical protein